MNVRHLGESVRKGIERLGESVVATPVFLAVVLGEVFEAETIQKIRGRFREAALVVGGHHVIPSVSYYINTVPEGRTPTITVKSERFDG
ncbi:MAG: hypothetical protein ABEJ73_08030 [Haloplanus sp.]